MGQHTLLLNRKYFNTHTPKTHQAIIEKKILSNLFLPRVLLCHDLASVCSLREDSQTIADIFLSRKAEFLVFTTYIGHYDRSMSLLEDSCRTSPAFAEIVQRFEV